MPREKKVDVTLDLSFSFALVKVYSVFSKQETIFVCFCFKV